MKNSRHIEICYPTDVVVQIRTNSSISQKSLVPPWVRGVALLEASAWLMMASVVLIGAIAWGGSANDQATLETTVKNSLRRTPVAATILDVQGRVSANIPALTTWATITSLQLSEDVARALPGVEADIVTCYWISTTERETGQTGSPASFCSSQGSNDELKRLLNLEVTKWFVEAPALAAIPMISSDSPRFLEFSIACGVGVRVHREGQAELWNALSDEMIFVTTFLPSGDVGI